MSNATGPEVPPLRCHVCDVAFASAEERDQHRAGHEIQPSHRARKGNEARDRRRAENRAAEEAAQDAERAGGAALALVQHVPGCGPLVRRTTRLRINPALLPVEYVNELRRISDRLLAVLLDLDTPTLWTVLGQIALLADVTDRAEDYVSNLRRDRAASQAAAFREHVVMREAAAQRLDDEPYVPPPLEAPRRLAARTSR